MAKPGRKAIFGEPLRPFLKRHGVTESEFRRHLKAGKSYRQALDAALGVDVPSSRGIAPTPDVTEPDMSDLTLVEPDTGAWGPAG